MYYFCKLFIYSSLSLKLSTLTTARRAATIFKDI